MVCLFSQSPWNLSENDTDDLVFWGKNPKIVCPDERGAAAAAVWLRGGDGILPISHISDLVIFCNEKCSEVGQTNICVAHYNFNEMTPRGDVSCE